MHVAVGDTSDTIREVWSLATELYNGREHIAGSRGEYREAERIRGVLESYLNENVELVKTPVTSWRLRDLDVYPKPVFASIAPYVPSGDVEARTYMVEGDPSNYRVWRSLPEGSIAVVIPPGNPDDLKYVALHAWEMGALGVIVGSRVPRKIVTTGSWGYSYVAGAPLPIPIVIVDLDTAKKAVWEGRARILVGSSIVESKGYTLRVQSGGPPRIVFTSHYDRWYSGFQDNILGIAQATVSYKRIRSLTGSGIIVFTAEEHGAPGVPGWYWSWGSRWLSRQYLESGLEDSIKLMVNYDVAGSGRILVSGAPQYAGIIVGGLESLGVSVGERCCECPECDSMSFHRIGVPSISVHTLWNETIRSIYHTPLDTPERADPRVAGLTVEAVTRSVLRDPRWGLLEEKLIEVLGNGPLLARRILEMIVRVGRSKGWERLYRWLSRNHLKPVLYGDYRYDYGEDIEAVYFPEVASMKVLEKSNQPHTIMIPGEERILYQLKPNGRVEEQFRMRILELYSRVMEDLKCL